jgi:histidinol-phosphatase (PHP family)
VRLARVLSNAVISCQDARLNGFKDYGIASGKMHSCPCALAASRGMDNVKMMPDRFGMFPSYHNHTIWSDGNASVMEMVDAARKAGIRELGISDHFILESGGTRITAAVTSGSLGRYVDALQQARESTRDMDIRIGLEVDFSPETFEETVEQLHPFSFDFLIGSVHCVDGFQVDRDFRSWKKLRPEARDIVWHGYWVRIREAIETRFFDIIGHFDLPKKFGCYPSRDCGRQVFEALDALAATNTALEINTSGWDKPVGEAYPSLFYLQEARRRDIPIVISADAHDPSHINRHFERACLWASIAGYNETACFSCRKRSSRDLITLICTEKMYPVC